jgi:S-DNA-T family DNA segregation ATPase FtsK/SpoIIIE
MWRGVADGFVFTMAAATELLHARVAEMDRRYDVLLDTGRRNIEPGDPWRLRRILVDELAYFTATIGTKTDREKFLVLLRDLVARGRAAGIIVVVATQRPTAEAVSTSLRDLFPYRWAFRCTTEVSSDMILWLRVGQGGLHRHRYRPDGSGCRSAAGRGGAAPPDQGRIPAR